MKIQVFDEGVVFSQDSNRLTAMLVVPHYSFRPPYETARAGCPIGLDLLASELVTKGFNVIFFDACMGAGAYRQFTLQADGMVRYGLTDGQLENAFARFPSPDIVGITSLFSNQASSVEELASMTRRVYPGAVVVEGGSHATGAVNEVLESSNVDIIVRNEGFLTFPELCQRIEDGQSKHELSACAGISFKDRDGVVNHNPDRLFIPTLDLLAERRLEIPLHLMYDTPEHTGGSRHLKTGRLVYINGSMGCPYACTFCHIPILAGNIRFSSLERFEREIALLAAAGVTEIVIEDDMFLHNIPWAMAITRILGKYNMAWFQEGGISMFALMKPGNGLTYQQILDCFAKYGCYRFYLAIESFNRSSLKGSRKSQLNADADLAEEIVRCIAKVGIEAVGGFMVGFKGIDSQGVEFEETLTDMEMTVAYAKRLIEAGLSYVMIFIFTGIKGTKAYQYLKTVFPNTDISSSHEIAKFPVGGLTPKQLTEKRLEWMGYVNGDARMEIAGETRNWGL